MLYLLFYYFLITGVCLWAGVVMYSFTAISADLKRTLVVYLLTGLIGLTACGQCLVLFVPVSGISLGIILFFMSFLTAFRFQRIAVIFENCRQELCRQPGLVFICLSAALLMIVILNAGPTMMDDTDSYHIQMVKWVQDYGTVPGIANLHLRFGFNSSWFVSIALLSYSFPGLNSFTALNGLISLWFCFFLIQKIFRFSFGNDSLQRPMDSIGCLIILFICLLNWPALRGAATSGNYDFIATCCVTVLFVNLFEEPEVPPLEWMIWPFYLFTVRMTNAPILLLSLVYIFYKYRSSGFKVVVNGLTLGIIFILPFLARNLILSGYIFFPVHQLDWFHVDWKADKYAVSQIAEYIKYYNRVNSGFRPLSETRELLFPEWVKSWYHYLFRADKVLVTLSVFGYLFILTRFRSRFTYLQKCLIVVAVIQLICWFFSAPDPRFVQGWLLFGIYASLQIVQLTKLNWRRTIQIFAVFLIIILPAYGISKIILMPDYRNPLIPYKLPVPAFQTIVVDKISLHVPSKVLNNWNPRCYAVELPCLYRVDPRLRARGPFIKDGFRLNIDSLGIPVQGEYKIKD